MFAFRCYTLITTHRNVAFKTDLCVPPLTDVQWFS